MTEKENSTTPNPSSPRRRKVLNWFWGVLASLACLEFGWISFKVFGSRSLRRIEAADATLIDAGMTHEFKPGTVTAVVKGQFYLCCLEDGSFIALSRTCTHLGCAIPWNEDRGLFVCPCHGSAFDARGMVKTPPAVRPLDYYKLKIENGLIRVDTSRPLKRDHFSASQTAHV